MKTNLRKTKAFTLIELIVVIIIIGILAAIAAIAYSLFIKGANESATESSAVSIGKLLAGDSAFQQVPLNDYTPTTIAASRMDDLANVESVNAKHVIFNPANGSQFTLLGNEGSRTPEAGSVEVCNEDYSYCTSAVLPAVAGAEVKFLTTSSNTGTGDTGDTGDNTGDNTGDTVNAVSAVLNPDRTITLTWTTTPGVDYELGASPSGGSILGYLPVTTSPYTIFAGLPAGDWEFTVRERVTESVIGTVAITKDAVANSFGNLVANQPSAVHVDGTPIVNSQSTILQWDGDTLNEGGDYTVCIDGDCVPVERTFFNNYGGSNFVETTVGPGTHTFQLIDNSTGDSESTAVFIAPLDTTPRIVPGDIGGAKASYLWFGGDSRDTRWTTNGNSTPWTTATQGEGINMGTASFGGGLGQGDSITFEVRDANGNIVSATYTQP